MKPRYQIGGALFSQRMVGLAADSAITEQGHFRIASAGRTAGSAGALRLRAVIPTEYVGRTQVVVPALPELASLRVTVSSLQERVRALEDQLVPTVVVVRELSPAEAKRELLEYFKSNPDTYPSDAATALRLDSAVVRDLCRELVDDGLLGG